MKLMKLKLNNFQGIKSLEIEFNGQNTSIYGDNAAGKTTIANAFIWLLSGKAFDPTIKNFTPEVKDINGNTIHHLDNSVEGEFQADDGRIFTLTKVNVEKWTKKKGAEEKEYSGTTVNYYVDGVSKKMKEYDQFVAQAFGDLETAKTLTNINHFNEVMKPENRRALLFDVCGTLTDLEIINATTQFTELKEALLVPGTTDQYRPIEEFKKIQASIKMQSNKELSDLEVRIPEAKNAIPDVASFSEDKLRKELADLNVKTQRYTTEIADLQNTNPIQALENKKQDIRREISNAQTEYLLAQQKALEPKRKQRDELQRKHNEVEAQCYKAKRSLIDIEDRIATANKLNERLKDEYTQASKVFFDENTLICPTCGQEYPVEKQEELKNNFNLKKSQLMEEIVNKAKEKCSKEVLEQLNDELNAVKAYISQLEPQLTQLNKEINAIENELNAPGIPFDQTAEYQVYYQKLEEINQQIAAGSPRSLELQIEGKQSLIAECNLQIQEINQKLGLISIAEAQNKRVEELIERRSKTSKEYATAEKNVALAEKFIKAKADMISSSINNHFKTIKFKLFETQVNGGIVDCCKTLIPTPGGSFVPYEFANSAAQYNANLEIIDTLSKHFNISIPVFVDNAESVTKLINIDNQVIRLVVSEPDKQLRIVREGE